MMRVEIVTEKAGRGGIRGAFTARAGPADSLIAFGGRVLQLFAGPRNEIFHIGTVFVAAVMLPPRKLAIQQAEIDRQRGRAEQRGAGRECRWRQAPEGTMHANLLVDES